MKIVDKAVILEGITVSPTLYGSEFWVLNAVERRRTEKFNMTYSNSIIGMSWTGLGIRILRIMGQK